MKIKEILDSGELGKIVAIKVDSLMKVIDLTIAQKEQGQQE